MDLAQPVAVAPGLARVTAPNASPWTAQGTNSYLIGPVAGSEDAGVLLVDPGPDDERHLAALCSALDGRPVGAILCTHSHIDHSGLASRLAEATGAPVLAFGDSRAGCRPVDGDVGGGGGVHREFRPDALVADGARLAEWGATVLHTPGHMGNHVCLDLGDWLLTGDHAMGWATTLVSPPEGDMGDYVSSTRRLEALGPRRLLPGHGALVEDGQARLRRLLDHRREREAEVLATLADGPASAPAIAERVYAGLSEALRRAATRNVLAHLIDLDRRGLAAAARPLAPDVRFRLAGTLDTLGAPR